MKVLHVIPSVGPLRGGPSFVIRTLARAVAAQGVEVHVAATDDNGPGRGSAPVDDEGATYWFFPRQTRFYTISLPFAAWLWRHARDYDLIHIHALFSYCPNVAAWIARLRGIPYLIRPLGVLNRWGMENQRPWLKRISFRFLERGILARAAAVHFTSEQERVEADELGVSLRPLVIPNPSATHSGAVTARGEFRASHPEFDGRKLVLFLSRLDAKKGLDLLLPAFERVRAQEPNAALIVAGSGDPSFVTTLKAEAARIGLDGTVHWAGFVAGREKATLLADADVFVLPSYSENFGLAVVEAMAARLPVVVSDQVAIHREITQAAAGVVVPCDVAALAGALVRLLADAQTRRQMGDRAAELVERCYTPEAVSRQVVDAYRRLIGGCSSRSAAASPAVSAIILTHNEESNLPGCLESLRGLNCELFVVDSGSTDRTLDIARAAGAVIAGNPFEHYGAQRNWAQQNLPLAAEWVLHLDADERLTPALVAEINRVIESPGDVDGFLFRKRTMFMGRWMRHGGHYPSYHLRLYRRARGHCEQRLYDQHYIVDGRVQTLENDYIDLLTADLGTWIARHARWAQLEAREIEHGAAGDSGRVAPRWSGTPIEQRRWLREKFYQRWPLFWRAFFYWFYRYVIRLGFLDGIPGLIFHLLQGFMFRFLIDAMIHESRTASASRPRGSA